MSDLHTTTKTFDNLIGERTITVQSNGGSVVWEIEHGDGIWLTQHTYVADVPGEMINLGINRTHRFTVSGGATYAF